MAVPLQQQESQHQESVHQESMQKILAHALTICFPTLIENPDFSEVSDAAELNKHAELKHIMFTVAALQFKALIFFHYHAGKEALPLASLLKGAEVIAPTQKDVDAFFVEAGNQLCGEIKRHFHKQFDYLGMSTPYILSPATSLANVADSLLITDCHQFYKKNNIFALGGSIYIFSKKAIAFEFNNSAEAGEVSSGELEFF
jgi:hypothetical protein